MGSIAAGGRYDNMVGQFAGKDIPAVGVSIGIERVMAIMEAKAKEATAAPPRRNKTDVLVTSIGPNLLPHRMRLCSALWAAGVKAEFPYAHPHTLCYKHTSASRPSLAATPKTPSSRSS